MADLRENTREIVENANSKFGGAQKMKTEQISVTELREHVREILENAHFRGNCYVVERAGQEMVVIIGVNEYRELLALAAAQSLSDRTTQPNLPG